MAQFVYGYAWKDAAGEVHKKFIYAESQDEADKDFLEMTKLDPNGTGSRVQKNRKPA